MNLIRLSEDRTLHVASNEPHVEKFDVYDNIDNKIGNVDDLIADTDTMKVRFLIVNFREGLFARKKLIIPVRDVLIDTDAEKVICNRTEDQLREYPEWTGGALPELSKRFRATFLPGTGVDRDLADEPDLTPRENLATTAPTAETTERPTGRIGEALHKLGEKIEDKLGAHTNRGDETTTGPGGIHREPVIDREAVRERIENRDVLDREPLVDREAMRERIANRDVVGRDLGDETRMEVVEEELQIGMRDVPLGEAVITKTVTEEQVCQPVDLTQERVDIERHPVNRPTNVSPGQGDMEVRVPLKGQEVVKEKRAVVREEIVLHTHKESERCDVCDTVKKEHVDVQQGTRDAMKPVGKHDVGSGVMSPVEKTDRGGDKIDMGDSLTDDLGRPDHMYNQGDRPII